MKRTLLNRTFGLEQTSSCLQAIGWGSFQTRCLSATANSVPVTRYLHGSNSSTPAVPQPFSLESHEATQLVDNLVGYTRSLMDGYEKHIIAYSGGIDSSVAAALVNKARIPGESVHAVLGLSPAVPSDQVALAEHVAEVIGLPLEQIPTTEGDDTTYIENSGQACLACKTHLYTCLESIVEHANRNQMRLYNGTNADDLNDPTRLGLIAADRFQVQSPLRHSTKEQVRLVGRYLGLPNWNYAASPCLRSRLAIGVEAVPEHLLRIEMAEKYVRKALELDATRNLRVRLLSKNRAMVEVEDPFLETSEEQLGEWQSFFREELEFASVNVRGFKSGSVAEVVTPTYATPIAAAG